MLRTIYEKKQKLREKAIRLDLVPDKGYSLSGRMGGNMIRYVSIGKFKRQFAPLFSECGLDFKMTTVQIEQLPTNDIVRGTFEFILTDTETGEQDVTRIVADGSSATDKGIVIASSYAMRMFFSNTFCLEDGIDYERNDNALSDGLSAKAIPSVDEAETTVQPNKRADKVSEPDPAPEKTSEPDSAKKTSEPVPAKDPLSKVERNAAENAIAKIEELYKSGAIVEDEYKRAVELHAHLSGSKDVLELVSIKRAGEKNVKSKKTEGM